MQQAKVGKDMGDAYGAGYPGLRSLRDFPPGASDGRTRPDRVSLWDADRGKALHRFKGHADAIIPIAVAKDGKLAVSGGIDQTVRMWNVPQPQ